MSLELAILLPHIILAGGACLFLMGGAQLHERRLWAPLCLGVLGVAALCVVFTSRGFAQRPDVLLQRPISPDPDATPAAAIASPLLASSFAVACEACILAAGFLFTLAGFKRQQLRQTSAQECGLMLLSICGVMLVAVSNDLVVAILGLELATLPAALMLWFDAPQSLAREAAGKTLVMHVLSTLLLLLGIVLVFGLTGETNLMRIAHILAESLVPSGTQSEVDQIKLLGRGKAMLGNTAVVLIVAGLGFRIGAVPFQFGSSETLAGPTLWMGSWLGIAPKLAGIVALVRLLVDPLIAFETTGQVLLMVLAGATMVIGSANALFATTIRRMLAGLTMAHGGFALVGIAAAFWDAANPQQGLDAGSGFPGGLGSALFFLASYVLSMGGIVAVLLHLGRPQRDVEHVDELAGLVRSEPAAAICLLIFFLSLTGFPPLAGFWARMFILATCVSAYVDTTNALLSGFSYAFGVLALAGVFHLLCMAAISYRVVSTMFLAGQAARPRPGGGQPALAAGVIAAGLLVAVGILPGPALGWLERVELINRTEALTAAGIDDLPRAKAHAEFTGANGRTKDPDLLPSP